jgi:hypothetical protein
MHHQTCFGSKQSSEMGLVLLDPTVASWRVCRAGNAKPQGLRPAGAQRLTVADVEDTV